MSVEIEQTSLKTFEIGSRLAKIADYSNEVSYCELSSGITKSLLISEKHRFPNGVKWIDIDLIETNKNGITQTGLNLGFFMDGPYVVEEHLRVKDYQTGKTYECNSQAISYGLELLEGVRYDLEPLSV